VERRDRRPEVSRNPVLQALVFELCSGKQNARDSLQVHWLRDTIVRWFFLIRGATGAVRVAIAKRFFEPDFTISVYVITDEQRKAAVHITPVQRWLIVLACIGVAIIGCFLIQHDANWNPFPHLRD
jgi:hypothetical protein